MNNKLRTETLLIFFFGRHNDYKIAGVNRAFRDFNRTLRTKEYNEIEYSNFKSETSKMIVDQLSYLLTHEFSNQQEFDDFHKQICDNVKNNWNQLTYGQIQKWINMTLKYWLIIGNEHINNIELNSKWFHIPIDSLILLEFFSEKHPKTPWSKIDYKIYFEYQLRFRENLFQGEIPIIKETETFNNLLKNSI